MTKVPAKFQAQQTSTQRKMQKYSKISLIMHMYLHDSHPLIHLPVLHHDEVLCRDSSATSLLEKGLANSSKENND